MHQQHVIDWLKHQGYSVTELSDGSLMCISQSALMQADLDQMSDAIHRQHSLRWSKPSRHQDSRPKQE